MKLYLMLRKTVKFATIHRFTPTFTQALYRFTAYLTLLFLECRCKKSLQKVQSKSPAHAMKTLRLVSFQTKVSIIEFNLFFRSIKFNFRGTNCSCTGMKTTCIHSNATEIHSLDTECITNITAGIEMCHIDIT